MLWINQALLNGIGGSSKGENMCKITQEVGNHKRKEQMQMWSQYQPCRSDQRLGVRLTAEELNMGIC
jgi:hypothetical protein